MDLGQWSLVTDRRAKQIRASQLSSSAVASVVSLALGNYKLLALTSSCSKRGSESAAVFLPSTIREPVVDLVPNVTWGPRGSGKASH